MEGAGRRVERPVVRPCRRPPPPLLAHPLYHTSIGGGPPGRLPGRAPSVPAGAVRLAVCGGGQPPACGGLVGGWRSSGGEGGRQCDGQALHGCSASLRCRAHPAPHPVPRRRAPPPPPFAGCQRRLVPRACGSPFLGAPTRRRRRRRPATGEGRVAQAAAAGQQSSPSTATPTESGRGLRVGGCARVGGAGGRTARRTMLLLG